MYILQPCSYNENVSFISSYGHILGMFTSSLSLSKRNYVKINIMIEHELCLNFEKSKSFLFIIRSMIVDNPCQSNRHLFKTCNVVFKNNTGVG